MSDLKTLQKSASEKSLRLAHDRSKKNSRVEELEDGSNFAETLFLDGSTEHIKQNSKKFWEIFNHFIELQIASSNRCDLSYIIFPHDQNGILKQILNKNDIEFWFNHCIFNESVNLSTIKIKSEITFEHAIFKKDVNFKYTVFYEDSLFSNISFEGNTYFDNSAFMSVIDFQNSKCSSIFDFSDVAFHSLRLDKSHFPHSSYLRLDGWDDSKHDDVGREALSTKHFETKETARIIKAHFEKVNNITESNVYYPIEMDKYREELLSYSNPFISFFTNQNYFVTTLSKYISNYGTSWLRAAYAIMLFSFLSSFIFSLIFTPENELTTWQSSVFNGQVDNKILIYLAGFFFLWLATYLISLLLDNDIYHKIEKYKAYLIVIFFILFGLSIVIFISLYPSTNFIDLVNTHNYVSRVVNPFGAFKSNDIFKNYEAFGTVIRLIMITLMYQFLVAFRQNTRRK